MYLTQEVYRKIEEWLLNRTVKDTDFPVADPLKGNEKVPVIQDGLNKTIDMDELVRQLSMMGLPDFLNMTDYLKEGNLSLEKAVNSVPVEQRKLGIVITFHSEKGHWMIYQFKGTSLNQWSSMNYWRSPVEEALEELIVYPDEEDITGVRDVNKTFLKLKNKVYDPRNFSGKGRVILRKNLKGTEACSLDDEDHYTNILTQDMIREPDTIYVIQYDFNLDGQVLSVPRNCTLLFQGGTINNGTLYIQGTKVEGIFEFSEIGTNINLMGPFRLGQTMTFMNDTVPEYKWWNGSEWKIICSN